VSLCDSIQILLQYMQIQIQIQIQNIITICYYNICKSNSFFKSWLLRSQPGLLALWRQKENIFCTNMLLSLLFSSQICFGEEEKLFLHKYAFVVRRLLAVQRIVDQWFSGILQQILNEFGNGAKCIVVIIPRRIPGHPPPPLEKCGRQFYHSSKYLSQICLVSAFFAPFSRQCLAHCPTQAVHLYLSFQKTRTPRQTPLAALHLAFRWWCTACGSASSSTAAASCPSP